MIFHLWLCSILILLFQFILLIKTIISKKEDFKSIIKNSIVLFLYSAILFRLSDLIFLDFSVIILFFVAIIFLILFIISIILSIIKIKIRENIYKKRVRLINTSLLVTLLLIICIPYIANIYLIKESPFIINIEYENNRTIGSSKEITVAVNSKGCYYSGIKKYSILEIDKKKQKINDVDQYIYNGEKYDINGNKYNIDIEDLDKVYVYKNGKKICSLNDKNYINLDEIEIFINK